MNRSEAGKLGYIKTKEAMDAARDRKSKYCRDQFLALNKKCLFCAKEISFEGRKNDFCSHNCAGSYYAAKQREALENRKVCPCGMYTSRNNKYCDLCISKGVDKQKGSFELFKTDHTRRKHLLKERGNVCEMCGITSWLGKDVVLIMDHIDGNSDFNDKSNLRLICSNCDSTLPTYKSKNKGFGRKHRRNQAAVTQLVE